MPRAEPERTCLVTREAQPASRLMRFVLGPDGVVVADLRGRLPGRGAWLTPTADALGEAVRRKLFPKGFKTEARVPADFVAAVDAALVREVRGALSLANKAGAAVAGFAKVETALSRGDAAALIHAREAAEDGRRKLGGALRRGPDDPIWRVFIFDDLSGDDLGVALGREHVIHAALLAGPGSDGCLARWNRLRVFRGVDGAPERPRGAEQQQGDARMAGQQG